MGSNLEWFVDQGTPPRGGNLIRPMVDGETAWSEVYRRLDRAKASINLCFWMLEGDSELIRVASDEFKEPDVRAKHMLINLLIAKIRSGVAVRILLWTLPGWALTLNALADPRMRQMGQLGFLQIMYDEHPRTIGSWHQKTITIDGTVAFVGGMNAKENDWDTISHTVLDYRRTPHKTTGNERSKLAKQRKLPSFPPRHDLMALIEGPLARDVEANFAERWNNAIDLGAVFSETAKRMQDAKSVGDVGNMVGQIVRTIPVSYPPKPQGETGILESYRKAISKAKKYIYIEDQYFRSVAISEAIAQACTRNKDLKVIIVAPPAYFTRLEPNERWKLASPVSTYWTTDSFERIAKVRPNLTLFLLQVTDLDADKKPRFVPIDIHAKIMIIDDSWFTIGSANINDRGMQHGTKLISGGSFYGEGEINICVHDGSAAKKLRRDLWSEHLELDCGEDVDAAIATWNDHAKKNMELWSEKKKPVSRILPYVQTGPLLPATRHTWW